MIAPYAAVKSASGAPTLDGPLAAGTVSVGLFGIRVAVALGAIVRIAPFLNGSSHLEASSILQRPNAREKYKHMRH